MYFKPEAMSSFSAATLQFGKLFVFLNHMEIVQKLTSPKRELKAIC